MEREGCCVCKCLKIAGICFEPSDEEILAYYLTEKIEGRPLPCDHLMTELKIYDDDLMPWEILKDDNPYWITSSSDNKNSTTIKKTLYVFTELRKKKTRVIRRSGRGSWTGQNNPIVQNKADEDIGYNKLLTFFEDSADKKGKKKKIVHEDHGHWIMHEYSLFGNDSYVLCKIIKEEQVRFSAKASVLCPTKAAAAATQDFRNQGHAEIMNVVSDDERQLGTGGDEALDESTTDWDENGWTAELYQQLGTDISDVQELPIDSQPITFDGQEDNNDIIILDECSTVVHDVKELMMIGTADPPRIQATNVDDHADNDMEGNKQIVDDFWNFEPVGASPAVSPLNTTWDGLDVILDFSSPELCDLWGNETNEQSCNIFEGQHEKRMRYGEEDCEECPTGKKQRCLLM